METTVLILPVPDPADTRRNKLALLSGFAVLLVLLIGLGWLAAATLSRAASADSEQTRHYLERRRLLGDASTAVISATVAIRDFLMDPDPAHRPVHAADTRTAWAQLGDRIDEYARLGNTATIPAALTHERAHLGQILAQTLEATPAASRMSSYEVLSERISPSRNRLLAQLEELTRADQQTLNETVQQTATALRKLQYRLRTAIAISVLLGMLVAAFAYRHFARLETLAAERYGEAVAAAQRSEQLSHRLLSVQEQERKRLARELHDEVGQALGAMLVDLGQARTELDRNPTEARARLESAAASGEHTLRVVRDISLLLRPSMLDELGLIPALHWQAREVSRRSGLLTTVQSSDDDMLLDEELRTTVFRLVQEALQNAAKHSGARAAEVGIATQEGRLRILITDNGKGFDPGLTRGVGLLGMEERVARLGGTLRISSAPSQGTTITADLPLGPRNSNEHKDPIS